LSNENSGFFTLNFFKELLSPLITRRAMEKKNVLANNFFDKYSSTFLSLHLISLPREIDCWCAFLLI